MLMGEYNTVLDEKNRLYMPAKLRKAMGNLQKSQQIVLTHGFDTCIMGFRMQEWVEFVEEKLLVLSLSKSENREFVRFLLGGASEVSPDKHGRILIPNYLRDYAGINREITVIGLYDTIEIWSHNIYARHKPKGEKLNEFAVDFGLKE